MKKIILITLLSFCSIGLFAQPLPPAYPHGTNGDLPAAPIDGGLSILLALGAVYGAQKVYILKKKSKKEA
jgi:hypothetical protein